MDHQATPGPDFKKAEAYILERLKNELQPTLYYHGAHHTDDVIRATMKIATAEKNPESEIQLLRIAAAYHDAGFIYIYQGHEEKGCEMASQTLPGFGFNPSQIESICGMIMATKIPQQPKNKLEEIIADADLDYLGRDDVYDIAQTLFEELKIHADLNDEDTWKRIQINFISSHHFHTAFSIQNRGPKKDAYLRELKGKLKS